MIDLPHDSDDSDSLPGAGHASVPDEASDGAGGAGLAETPTEGGAPDGTLGGYLRTHDRPPAFDGPDGHPYTVSIEVERTGDLTAPHHGYLVFPRWAQTGVGIVGHVESPTLVRRRSAAEARAYLEGLELAAVRAILDGALSGREDDPTL